MGEIIIKSKKKLIMILTIFLILFVLIGSVSAANDNNTALSQDTDKVVNQEEISTGNSDSSLILKSNDENTAFKTPVDGVNFTDIQNAINSATSGETIELSGHYKGNGTEITIDKDNLTITGTKDTTLDAQGQSRIFTITGNGITLKNIKFKNANSDNGGAICWNGTDGTVDNCSFTKNAANSGGAICWNGTGGTVSNCKFSNNKAESNGGAIYWDCDAGGVVSDCDFNCNTAYRGGVITWSGDNGTVSYCRFSNNKAETNGGAIYWIVGKSGVVSYCSFSNNTANQTGEAIFWVGADGTVSYCNFTNNTEMDNYDVVGGSIDWYGTNGKVNNCNFYNNKAKNGGAIFWAENADNGVVTDCYFIGNAAKQFGGAIYWNAAKGTVNNCIFTGNRANQTGGAIFWNAVNGFVCNSYFTNNKGEFHGGAILWAGADGVVSDCDFNSNSVYENGIVTWNGDNGTVSYCNFTNNKAGMNGSAINFNSAGTIENCNFTGNAATFNGGAVRMDSGNVRNCIFTDNHAIYNGGAVWLDSGSIENCNFINSHAGFGGAVWLDSGSIKNCNFTNSNANTDNGGAVYFFSAGNVTNCNFINNHADEDGGAVWMGPGNVSDCNFVNNSAANGGGALYFSSSGPGTVKNCNFTGNAAIFGGGAVNMFSGSVENCNFTGNTANHDGGAIRTDSGTFENCYFTNNTAKNGGAVLFYESGTVICCIFVDNSAGNAKAIYFTTKGVVDTCIFNNMDSNTNFNAVILPPTLDVDNYTTVYGSGGKLIFDLKTNSKIPVTNGNISITVYFKDNNTWAGVYSSFLSGEGWIPDLPVGFYYAIFDTEYANFQQINRTITIIPNIPYYVNVTSLTSYNKTVNITAKSNIPQDIVQGKLLFILPDASQINATYGTNGTWWALHTFDYGVYQVNASYNLDGVVFNNATINITKTDPTITLDDITLSYGESKNITVKTEGAVGITACINGANVTVINNFTIPISDLGGGNYTLTVTTVPDGDHNSASKEVKIIVNKATGEIILTNDTIDLKVKENVSAGAVLNPASAGNLTYSTSNENIVGVSKDGLIVAYKAGNVTVTVSFAGNENYTAAVNRTIKVNVTLVDASVSVNNSTLDLFVGDTFTIVASTSPAGLNVNYVPDNSGVVGVDENGKVTALKEGNATIIVKVGGDGVYAEKTVAISVCVSKVPTEITVDAASLELFVGYEAIISATLTPYDAGDVIFTSSNESVVEVLAQGKVIANEKGQAIITVSFAGNNRYAAAENKTIIVDVKLKDASVTVDNGTLDLIVGETYAINATKHPHSAFLDIAYTSSDNSVVTVDERGIVSAVGGGTAVITVEVGDDETYAKNSTTVNVTVSRMPTEIAASAITTVFNVNKNIVITLKDANGNPVSGADITVNLNGAKTYTTNEKGQVKVPIKKCVPKKYTAKITFNGNIKYANSTKSVKVTVKKATPKLSAKAKTFKKSVKTKKYTVTLKTNQKKVMKNTKLTLKVNKKTYTAKTNAKGQATFKITKLTKKGKHTATIKYAGSKYYNAKTVKAKITVK